LVGKYHGNGRTSIDRTDGGGTCSTYGGGHAQKAPLPGEVPRGRTEHVTGKYVISDRPMTEEQWIRERATVIDGESTDVTPELEDKSK
jgi:hypothetical protein